MSSQSCGISGAFELISECFDELKCKVMWGDSTRETFDEAIRTYKRCVEKINEKIDKLFHEDTTA